MLCYACNRSIRGETPLKCTVKGCTKLYHLAYTTTSSKSKIDTNTWACQDCRCASKKGGDNTSTPIRNEPNSSSVTVRKNNQNSADNNTEILSEIKMLRVDFGTIQAQLTSMTAQYNDRLDILEKKLQERDSEITELKAALKLLKEQGQIQNNCFLANEIEITGLPEAKNESLQPVKVVESDIDWIFTLCSIPTDGEPPAKRVAPTIQLGAGFKWNLQVGVTFTQL